MKCHSSFAQTVLTIYVTSLYVATGHWHCTVQHVQHVAPKCIRTTITAQLTHKIRQVPTCPTLCQNVNMTNGAPPLVGIHQQRTLFKIAERGEMTVMCPGLSNEDIIKPGLGNEEQC